MNRSENPHSALTVVALPFDRQAVDSPPALIASSHTTDYQCATCGTVLMHAEQGQVHGLIIHCVLCGAYNATAV